ncbi:hypothetical protein [Methylobrevis albus]|uniref:Uncharacterized protein n=1 Tax=Methylobrevis albus TaxID=2793297 RepID=A0A931I1B7_9HYPH|nr:hypothetical protein [Methylobrevis albus]MBH0237554.1 hypothetical protein [Methylobrevis albus]
MRRTIGSTLAIGLFIALIAPVFGPRDTPQRSAVTVETRSNPAAGAMVEVRADLDTPAPVHRRDETARAPLSEAALGIGDYARPARTGMSDVHPEPQPRPEAPATSAVAARPAPVPPTRPAPPLPLVAVYADAAPPAFDALFTVEPIPVAEAVAEPASLVSRAGDALRSGKRAVVGGTVDLARAAADASLGAISTIWE